MEELPTSPPPFKMLDAASDLLDSKFRIPGTNIRFGLDFLIGLVPFAGDLLTYCFSGLLVLSMAKNGASGMVVVKMLWNILVDTLVGSIPILGDLFDFQFKANRRNYQLLVEHHEEGRHQGSAWPVIIGVVLALLLLLLLFFALTFWGLSIFFDWAASFF